MKGMKIEQFTEVVNFIQKYHKFALCLNDEEIKNMKKLYPKIGFSLNIKYIDSCYDSRFADIWSISFRGMGSNVCFYTNTELNLPFQNLFDWVMAYLKSEWMPTETEIKSILKPNK